MSGPRICRVEVKRDHLSKLAAGKPESALAEMIWNALDADASEVAVSFREGPLGPIDEIVISDNGTGIPYEKAEALFSSLGGSWKVSKRRTDGGRFLHGRDGKGRFKAFVLGKNVRWRVIYRADGQLRTYAIEGKGESLDEFILTEEQPWKGDQPGVEVRIRELNRSFHLLDKDQALVRLTPVFAPYLSNYASARLTFDGKPVNPAKIIRGRQEYKLQDLVYLDEAYQISLELIEWNQIIDHNLWFCDEIGFPLETYDRQIRGTGDFGFTGYLKSEVFPLLHSHGLLAISEMHRGLSKVCAEAISLIKQYFTGRTLESNKDQLERWKEERVYPYEEGPQSPVEAAERQVFDIIALSINENLPNFESADTKTKTFQFRMLRQAIEKSPAELQLIMQEVIQLPPKKQEQLAELLKDTSLSAIISASKMVSDRLRFLSGLEQLLFDPNFKTHLKERTQLHRILAENSWIFGHSFSLSVDDKSLTEVLRKHSLAKGMTPVIDEPVKRIDGSIGIVDLMLSRSIPRNHSSEREHLIVELKAPRVKVGQAEIEQIKGYAYAVASDERFRGLDTRWNFWVISNDIDQYAEYELSQPNYEDGVIHKIERKNLNLTIWVKVWSQLIQDNKHRLQFVQNKLNYNIDSEDAIAYLRKTYTEYTQGVLVDEGR